MSGKALFLAVVESKKWTFFFTSVYTTLSKDKKRRKEEGNDKCLFCTQVQTGLQMTMT
jgi:hypothetical protein